MISIDSKCVSNASPTLNNDISLIDSLIATQPLIQPPMAICKDGNWFYLIITNLSELIT